ncbi:MAG: T9SS type A sorting domain-containing protein [Bacteroidetes bacterium]|nr:T9SS type A sorting domain-containing protein [Bacteroidota bacterium]
MKYILAIMACLLSSQMVNAQTPAYSLSHWPSTGSYAMIAFDGNDHRAQTIYSSSYFSGMPRGEVTAVYFRCSAMTARDTITYHNVDVSLGNTVDTQFNSYGTWDTFRTELTRVYSAPTHFFSGAAVSGTWFKFSTSASFTYDPAQHLVVELRHGPEGANNYGGFRLLATTIEPVAYKTLAGPRDSIRSKFGESHYLMDVGFDIAPNGVPGIENLRSLGLFPNPCTEAQFMLSLSAKKPMRMLSITLTDAVGRQVLHKEFSGVGTEFFEGIPTAGLAKGLYLARITAGGESLSRKLIIE